MYKYFRDVKTIRFPVYNIYSTDWYEQDGLLMIDGRILDDKNMPGTSLGVRRLQTGRKQDLIRLKRAHSDFLSMISSGRNRFIDSNGEPFVYVKSITAPLKYHLITKIEGKEDHSVVWCYGLPYPFSIPRPPYGDARYAGILYYNGSPWMVYNFATTKGKDSFRRV